MEFHKCRGAKHGHNKVYSKLHILLLEKILQRIVTKEYKPLSAQDQFTITDSNTTTRRRDKTETATKDYHLKDH